MINSMVWKHSERTNPVTTKKTHKNNDSKSFEMKFDLKFNEIKFHYLHTYYNPQNNNHFIN